MALPAVTVPGAQLLAFGFFLVALLRSTPLVTAQPSRGNWPPRLSIPIGPPSGAVAATETNIYTASQNGELYLVNTQSGNGTLLNPGGSGQSLGDLCVDSRDDKTLYGAGRATGILFAFDRRGRLLRRLRLAGGTSEARRDEADTDTFISSCIQSRYWLIVADARREYFYKLGLQDVGNLRGQPPLLDEDGGRQGEQVRLGGDWESAAAGKLGAVSVEWSRFWNETGWMLNSDTGKLYTFDLGDTGTADMRRVFIEGDQIVFPGSVKIMFDSTNEHVMYIAHPGRNAIAVIEIVRNDISRAKYIKTITTPLLNSPVALSEFGDWIYALNGNFDAANRQDGVYSLVQLSRHFQNIPEDADPEEPFSAVPGGDEEPPPEVYDTSTTQGILTSPQSSGLGAPPAPREEEYTPFGEFSSTTEEDEAADELAEAEASEEEEEEEEELEEPAEAPATSTSEPERPRGGTVFTDDGAMFDEGENASCFPADAAVYLESGISVFMEDLQIGDRVLVAVTNTADGEATLHYSPVYMFTHSDPRAETVFLRLHHDAGNTSAPLDLSAGHYLYVNDAKALTAASRVVAGDVVQVMVPETGTSISTRVTSVTRIVKRGLYNPQTLHGDIVVNSVRASTYTTAIHPRTARALLTPVRALAAVFNMNLWRRLMNGLDLFKRGSPRLASLLPSGPAVVVAVR